MVLTVPAEALQAVSQQFTVSVDPPCFIHHLVQLFILVLSCQNKTFASEAALLFSELHLNNQALCGP